MCDVCVHIFVLTAVFTHEPKQELRKIMIARYRSAISDYDTFNCDIKEAKLEKKGQVSRKSE
jgi:hypothetical protein